MTLEEAARVVEQLNVRLDSRYVPYICKPGEDEPRGNRAGGWEVHIHDIEPEGVIYYLIKEVPDDIDDGVAYFQETSQ